MEDKLTNVVDKLPIDGIDGYIEKGEGLPTRSELFSLVFLAPEWPFKDFQPFILLFFDNQLRFYLSQSTCTSTCHYCVKIYYPWLDCLIIIFVVVGYLPLVIIIFFSSIILVVVVFYLTLFLFNITALLLFWSSSTSPSPCLFTFLWSSSPRLFYLLV